MAEFSHLVAGLDVVNYQSNTKWPVLVSQINVAPLVALPNSNLFYRLAAVAAAAT